MANGAGTLRIFDRAEEMTILALGMAVDFQLEGNRIGVLLEGGVFKVKDGTHGPWSTLAASGAVAFKLDGNLIGVFHEDGRLRVKRGISGPWHLLDDSGIVSFDLETASPSTERVVFLRADGLLRGQERLANPALVDLAAGVTNFKLAGNRIAATRSNGEFQVTDGLFNAWTVLESEPLRQYELSAQRIRHTDRGRPLSCEGRHSRWLDGAFPVHCHCNPPAGQSHRRRRHSRRPPHQERNQRRLDLHYVLARVSHNSV